jgi:hypothetical protein
MTLSQIAFAIGLRGGDFNTLTPSFVIDSSRCLANILSRSCNRYSYRSCSPMASRNCCSAQDALGGQSHAMNQALAVVLNHDEHIQQSKRCSHGDEETAGNDSLSVQAQK